MAIAVWAAFLRGITVSSYTITDKSIPASFDGYRIAVLTDLHCARFGENQSVLTDKIRGLEPDAVFFIGDMLDAELLEFAPIEELCSALHGIAPIYAVYGNHDRWVSKEDFSRLNGIYRKYDVTVLCDETVFITLDGSSIALSGADDPAYWSSDINSFLEENPPAVAPAEGLFNILLYHRANAFPYTSGLGFELVVSGHMHGGQIRLPLLGGVISPTRGEYFPDYTRGLYSENGSAMIVGTGLGSSVSVPRIFNPPEIVLITLKSKV